MLHRGPKTKIIHIVYATWPIQTYIPDVTKTIVMTWCSQMLHLHEAELGAEPDCPACIRRNKVQSRPLMPPRVVDHATFYETTT